MGAVGTLWLVGMMGAGKSSVGPALARRLARPFFDSDAEIERRAGRAVAEIFEREGEASFRSRERAAIEQLAGQEAVVALGGGAIAQPGVAEILGGAGTVVYLRARPETLLARLGDCAERPLLRGAAPPERAARLRRLLAERRDAYESAQIVVDTDELAIGSVVDAIARRLSGPAPDLDAAGGSP